MKNNDVRTFYVTHVNHNQHLNVLQTKFFIKFFLRLTDLKNISRLADFKKFRGNNL